MPEFSGVAEAKNVEWQFFRCDRKRALEKLDSELKNLESAEKSKLDAAAWTSSNDIVRGNPVRVYEGKGFKLIN